ncbi:hypothetical protein Tco_0371860 [Tanacetum coccineum]
MKDIFEELEAEVDQNGIDRKHNEIERKNLFIANDNLIADCLSKEVFYVATNSELNVSSFTEMHDAHTSLKARCLELEVELSNLRDKIQKDNHNELVKRFSNLGVWAWCLVICGVLVWCVAVSGVLLDAWVVVVCACVVCLWVAKSVNMKKVEEHPRTIKSSLKTTNRVDSSISSKHNVVQIVLWYLDLGCSKHMTGDRSRLRNFMKKFIGTVRLGNDHFGAIMGYGDYVIGESVISRHSCYVRDTDGVELIKGSRGSNLYTISIKDMMKSSPICLLSEASKNKSWL